MKKLLFLLLFVGACCGCSKSSAEDGTRVDIDGKHYREYIIDFSSKLPVEMKTVEAYSSGETFIRCYSYEFPLEQFPEHDLRYIICNEQEIPHVIGSPSRDNPEWEHPYWYYYDNYSQRIDVNSLTSGSVNTLVFKLYKEHN